MTPADEFLPAEAASTPGFGALYYTDCTPGQGLQGGAGFQFQAASGPPAVEAMALVQRTALYEPPPSWMRERRPVGDYPRSLAHTVEDGLLVTAAGCYLGQEANGTREGNQFTHALATRDPSAYGLLRPAQLWAAPGWASAPAPSSELPPLPSAPDPGPLDSETVRDRIRAAPGGAQLLTGLLSAVQRLADPQRRRTVVLITADPERAACWIAAATLLVPQPAALRASFKIFVADGRYGQHDIVALHPDWAGPWADAAPGSGLAVFDLDAGRASAEEQTAAAQFWVPRFLADDVYDVLDAVELAGQFARTADPTADPGTATASAADRTAAMIVAAGEREHAPEQLAELAHWLLAAPEAVVAIARDAVLDAVIDAEPGVPVLRTLTRAAGERGWSGAAPRVQDALLAAELAAVSAAADGVAALPALVEQPALAGWGVATDSETRREVVASALRAARPDQVPALLTVAHRHRVHPEASRFRESAHAFADWWLDRTGARLMPEHWPVPPEALDWVRDELRQRLAGPQRGAALLAIRRSWWPHLRPSVIDPHDPLDRQVVAAAVEHLEPDERAGLLRDVLERAFGEQPADRDPGMLAWQTLFGDRSPAAAEGCSFLLALRAHDASPSPAVGARVADVLAAEPAPTEHGLWCARELHRFEHPLPRAAADLVAADLRLSAALDELTGPEPARPPVEIAAVLNAVPDAVLAIRAAPVVEALFGAPRDVAIDVLRRASHPPYRLAQALEQRWPGPSGVPDLAGCRAVYLTFLLIKGPAMVEGQAADLAVLERRLEDLVRAMTEPARAAVDTGFQPPLGKPWRAWTAEITSTRRKLIRRFEGRTGRRAPDRADPTAREG